MEQTAAADLQQQGEGLIWISLPSLIALRYVAAKLPRRLPLRFSSRSGHYVSVMQGRGMEFAESRPYAAGDDIRSIDWRITARTGKAHTKLFREERERAVIIGVDLQRTMHFATRGAYKSVVATQIAALLAWRALHQGDRLGGMVFAEGEHLEIRPQLGRSAVLQFLYQMVNHQVWSAKNPAEQGWVASAETQEISPFSHQLLRLRRVAHPGAQVIMVSDFYTLSSADEQHLRELSRHCEVALIMVYDPFEESLPQSGHYLVSDGVNFHGLDVAAATLRQQYRDQFKARLDYLDALSGRYRLRLLLCRCDEDPAATLNTICRVPTPVIASRVH
ncbi:MAG: DUF58 domain-containing protein [Gammaproteobacteria bacterium]|nr:DUF58 domain-containing protein [Gammaproteobacteria bacterium]